MVGEFMHHHMFYQIAQRHIAPLAPLVKDRFAENPHRIGAKRLIELRFLGERNTLVKPGQIARVVDLQLREDMRGRPVLDQQHDRIRRRPKMGRQRVDGGLREALELGEGGGCAIHPRPIGHGAGFVNPPPSPALGRQSSS
jgi:hypothetical protein